MNKCNKYFLIASSYFLISLFISCNLSETTKEINEKTMKKYFADMLSKTDKIEIMYFTANDTLTKILTNSEEINVFKEVINGKEETQLFCDTTGQLSFFKGDTLLLNTYFSSPATGSKFNKGVVTYYSKPDIYKTLFTYRAGMSIDEYYYILKKQ